jgi:hypothetical protein
MMKPISRIVLAFSLAALPLAPAHAGWKLVTHAVPVAVAKSKLTVTPAEDWNRSSHRASKKGETWSLDGPGINELYFLADLAPGETFFKDIHKKDHPMPAMGKAMQLTEISEFFESSARVSYNTSDFKVTNVEPAKFLDNSGVRFTYEFSIEGNPMKYKGVAQAALLSGKLYLISFAAPAIHFFDRDSPKARVIMDSAKL